METRHHELDLEVRQHCAPCLFQVAKRAARIRRKILSALDTARKDETDDAIGRPVVRISLERFGGHADRLVGIASAEIERGKLAEHFTSTGIQVGCFPIRANRAFDVTLPSRCSPSMNSW